MAWVSRDMVIDVRHSSVDAYGYDLVLNTGGVTRQVQLKSRKRGGKTSRYKINVALAEQPSGCIIWTDYAFTRAGMAEVLEHLFGAEQN